MGGDARNSWAGGAAGGTPGRGGAGAGGTQPPQGVAEVGDPYGEQPLLTSAMVRDGTRPSAEELVGVRQYLEAVVALRRAHVHCPDDAPPRRELLVPDPHAFGSGLSLTPAQLQRLRNHQRWVALAGEVDEDEAHWIVACLDALQVFDRDGGVLRLEPFLRDCVAFRG